MNKYIYPILLLAGIVGWSACGNNKQQKKEVVRDTTINKHTSFNNLFLDTNQIQLFLQKDSLFKKYEAQYIDFYKHRNFEYAWFDSTGLAEQAGNFMNLLSSTVEELKDSSLYNKQLEKLYVSFTTDSTHMENRAEIIKTELYLTGQFFNYASKVYQGSELDVTELGWFIPRKKIDLTAVLDSVIKTKGKNGSDYSPLNPQYNKLQAFLSDYNKMQQSVKWDSIPRIKKTLKAGDNDTVLVVVKQRLQAMGDMEKSDSANTSFDSSLVLGVKAFQQRMGLQVDGKVTQSFITELNVPIDQRIKQVLINMERMRWLPSGKDSSYILVNIPEYKLHVYEKGKQAFDMLSLIHI